MTTLTSVRCQHCGAPLSLSEGIRFVTCNFCKSELEVVRDANTTHTKVLQQLIDKTEDISDRLTVIEVQQEIDRLDREWDKWQERHLDRRKDGSLAIPSQVNAVLIGLAGLGGLIILATGGIIASRHFGTGEMAVGVCGAGVAILIALGQRAHYRRYQEVLLLYQNRRTVLLHKLSAARGES
jgi:uncharacterized Zn finger protein (UPF0148 family)